MADPLSIFTGALTIADVCVRVGEYLRSVQKASKQVDEELESLRKDIDNLNSVYTALIILSKTNSAQPAEKFDKPAGVEDPCSKLWNRTIDLLQEGRDLVSRLEEFLKSIIGDPSSTFASKYVRLDDLFKAIRLVGKKNEYARLRSRFTVLNQELDIMLTAINLASNSIFRSNVYTNLEQLPGKVSHELQELIVRLKSQVEILGGSDSELEPSIISAKAALRFASLNEHFYVQKADTSIWTGRKPHLELLRKQILNPRTVHNGVQRRFVVYGISGAGKTQFCCKFAQDHRESFWGIFWIDASSPQNATESWKKIAKIGHRDANEESGKHWLSNLQSPWLLIIDSADALENAITNQFPSGDRGCILITTRNPRLKINETVGHLSLDRLEEIEAEDLLRKATKHEPWDLSAKGCASSIAKHLGFLPLALVHAGRAIFHQLCTLQGYIPFFNRSLDDFRLRKPTIIMSDDDDGMGAFMSFDIIFSGLEAQSRRGAGHSLVSQDAIELLNVFSFFHSHDICMNIVIRAANNILMSTQESATKKDETDLNPPPPPQGLGQRLKNCAITLAIKLQRHAPVLPQMLRNLRGAEFAESRLRRAIDLLVRISLLSETSEVGSYSIHPLVHMWVRKRLSAAEQALWCDAAANVLASSIKIPPLADEAGDQDFYRRILPHVIQVNSHKAEIVNQFQRNRQNQSLLRSWMWMANPSSFGVTGAFNAARYSRVYMECAQFKEAEALQRLVQAFALERLGQQHPITAQIQLALSATLWHLAKAAEAQELQERALETCRLALGDQHPQTLRAMDALGETYWQRGWLKEAKSLHEGAIAGMKNNKRLTREKFKAMNHLGRVHEWYMEFDTARDLHIAASEGLSSAFGEQDLDAMIAADTLAMTLLQIGGMENTRRANEIMEGVYQRRKDLLGQEHVYTLWAACNLARTLAARGALEQESSFFIEAKQIFSDGLEVARRNLGIDHIGTLMGRTHLAVTFALEKNYTDAELEFKDIAERQKYVPGARAGTHRDRLWTLQKLVDCYDDQQRYDEAVEVCDTILEELDGIGGQNHPWRHQMRKRREDILKRTTQTP